MFKGSSLGVLITGTKALIYEEPCSKSKTVAKVDAGERLHILTDKKNWLEVKYKEQSQGWFHTRSDFRYVKALRESKLNYKPNLYHKAAVVFLNGVFERAASSCSCSDGLRAKRDRMFEQLFTLSALAEDAVAYRNGDPNAEMRFIKAIEQNHYVGAPKPDGNCNSTQLLQAILPIPGGGIDTQRFLPPCLFFPRIGGDILAGVWRMAEALSQQDQHTRDKIFLWHSQPLAAAFREMDQLQTIYGVARTLDLTKPEDLVRFANTVGSTSLSSGSPPPSEPPDKQIAPASGLLPPDLLIPSPGFTLDLCAVQRSHDAERALSCLCRESYEVTAIRNVDTDRADGEPLIGEFCPGQIIEITGRDFRSSRDVGIDDLKSQVVFPRIGGSVTPASDEEYIEWTDNRIVVKSPPDIISGILTLRIHCSSGLDASCGAQFRFALGSPTNRRFINPGPPSIDFVGEASPHWCSPGQVYIQARNAEFVTVTEVGSGASIPFDDGLPGERRDIAGYADVEETLGFQIKNLTVVAGNACGSTSVDTSVTWRRIFRVFTNDDHLPLPGASFGFTIDNYCSPAHLGWENAEFALEYDDPMGLLAEKPERAVIEGDQTQVSFDLPNGAPDRCGSFVVTVRAADPARYDEPAVLTLRGGFFEEISLTGVRVVGNGVCGSGLIVELTVDCFRHPAEFYRQPTVMLFIGSQPGTSMDITDIVQGPDNPFYGVRLICQYDGSIPLDVELRVLVGYWSTPGEFEMLALGRERAMRLPASASQAPSPMILEFRGSRGNWVLGYEGYNVSLNWRVRNVRRLELIDPLQGESRPLDTYDHDEMCDEWSESKTLRAQFGRGGSRTYMLVAHGFGSTSPVRQSYTVSDDTSTQPTPEPTPGWRSLQILNCVTPEQDIIVWVKRTWIASGVAGPWENKGTLSTGYDSSGACNPTQSVNLEFEDGYGYDISVISAWKQMAFSTDLVEEMCTSPDPVEDRCNVYYQNLVVGDSDGGAYQLRVQPGGIPLPVG